MTRHTNTATLIPAGLGVRDRTHLRTLGLIIALALAVAIGVVLAISVATPATTDLAPSYVGDWKDSLVGVGGAANRDQTSSGDWKDAFISPAVSAGAGSATTGDWKDSFLR